MSRAFVREIDDAPEPLAERPVSPHPNLVTARGARQIDARVEELERAREEARGGDDALALARVERDLRYWQKRRASAQRVETDAEPDEVAFGTRVTLRDDDGALRCFEIVGEDEAEPAEGRISWVSPVARALAGRCAGDRVALPGRSVTIEAIEPLPDAD
jgi:transcription elongation GreA/GreB family factor